MQSNDSKSFVDDEPRINGTVHRFNTKQKKGTIDVWWIYDDGGLTILMPFILKNTSLWRGSKLRVFSVSKDLSKITSEQYRYSDLHVESDSNQFQQFEGIARQVSNPLHRRHSGVRLRYAPQG